MTPRVRKKEENFEGVIIEPDPRQRVFRKRDFHTGGLASKGLRRGGKTTGRGSTRFVKGRKTARTSQRSSP